MKYIFILVSGLLIMSCGSSESEQNQKSNTEVVPVATSPVLQEDTIYVKALGANMSEMKFNIKAIRVPANKDLTIALINESTDATMPHNIVIIDKGTANNVGQDGYKFKDNSYINPKNKNVIAYSPLAPIGKTVYFTFTTPAAGDYEFICSYPGHWGMMKGKFITK